MLTNASKRPDLVFQAFNVHVPQCGRLAPVKAGQDRSFYCGYFENAYGEQFVLQIDRRSNVGMLRGGDLGWARRVFIAEDRVIGGVILGTEEFLWLAASWRAATGGVLQKTPFLSDECLSAVSAGEPKPLG